MTGKKHLTTAILTAAALLLATAPGFAQSQLFRETWNSAPPQTFSPGATGSVTGADNAWTYSIGSSAGEVQILNPGGNLNSVALQQMANAKNSTAPNSVFTSTNAGDLPGGNIEIVVLKARFQPYSVSSGNNNRLGWVMYGDSSTVDDATGQQYGISINLNTNPARPNLFSFRFHIRNSLGNDDIDIPEVGGMPVQNGSVYDVTTTFTKLGDSTAVQYYITENGLGYTAGSGVVARAIDNSSTLDRVLVEFTRYSQTAIDDIQVLSAPLPPMPIITVTPAAPYINAPGGATAETTVTIANAGTLPLTVSSCAIVDQTPSDAFSIVSGGAPPSDTITTSGGSRPSHDVVFSFNNTLAVADPPASATVLIFSDNFGVPDWVTTVTLLGYRIDTFTWNTGAQAYWTTDTAWSPQGVPAREDTAIVGSGIVTRSTALSVDPKTAGRDGAVTSLSLTGGELHVVGSSGNFSVGASVDGSGLFVLEGGLLQTQNDFRIAQALRSSGTLGITKGAVQVDGAILVGNANPSTAIVTMSGGTVTHTGTVTNTDFNVATVANSYGRWTHLDGTINASRDFYVGKAAGADGALTQSGGTVNVNRDIILGSGEAAKAAYTINDGALNVAGKASIASLGAGQLSIAGSGAVNINGATASTVGGAANAVGTIDVAGGALNFPLASVYVGNVAGAQGSLNITGGAVGVTSAGRDLVIGRNDGRGSLSVSGGQLTAAGAISLAGQTAGSNGAADFSGGIVSVGGNLSIAVGAGDITIRNNADVQIANDLVFGTSTTAQGSFTMTGGKLAVSKIRGSTGPNAVSNWSWTGGKILVSNASLPVALVNNGGTLPPGDTAIGTTIFTAGTTYTQSAGSLAMQLGDFGVCDQLVLTSATANLLGGWVDVSLTIPQPATAGSWDIIVATGNGSITTNGATFNLPGPAPFWTVQSSPQKVTVVFRKPQTLELIPATTVTMILNLSAGKTTDSKTVIMRNIGEFDLSVTSITLFGTSFTVSLPTSLPLTLTPGSADSATVAFDSQGTSGTFWGSIVFDSNDPQSPLVLGLQANVLEAILPASGIESWVRY